MLSAEVIEDTKEGRNDRNMQNVCREDGISPVVVSKSQKGKQKRRQ